MNEWEEKKGELMQGGVNKLIPFGCGKEQKLSKNNLHGVPQNYIQPIYLISIIKRKEGIKEGRKEYNSFVPCIMHTCR